MRRMTRRILAGGEWWAPRLKALESAFPSMTREDLKLMRSRLKAGRKLAAADIFAPGDPAALIPLWRAGQENDPRAIPYAWIMNAGDAYSPTLYRRTTSIRWYITTLGDVIEAAEKRGVRIY